jgi:hypothetical protein
MYSSLADVLEVDEYDVLDLAQYVHHLPAPGMSVMIGMEALASHCLPHGEQTGRACCVLFACSQTASTI